MDYEKSFLSQRLYFFQQLLPIPEKVNVQFVSLDVKLFYGQTVECCGKDYDLPVLRLDKYLGYLKLTKFIYKSKEKNVKADGH